MHDEKNHSGERMPRGVLAVVAIGLIACLAAALLATDKAGGSAADLEWVMEKPIADSAVVSVPGGGGQMRLTEGSLRATGSNASGYELYRAYSVLRIDAGSPVGSGRVECEMRVPTGTELAQTPKFRAAYPLSSEELFEQEVPEVVLVRFSSHGSELAVLEVEDLPERWATEQGIKLEWHEYDQHKAGWRWFLPPGPPREELVLPFFAVWRTGGAPRTEISCSLTTAAGTATVQGEGALAKHSEPLAE